MSGQRRQGISLKQREFWQLLGKILQVSVLRETSHIWLQLYPLNQEMNEGETPIDRSVPLGYEVLSDGDTNFQGDP